MQERYKNYRRVYRKYGFDFYDLQKNYSSRDTIPLKVHFGANKHGIGRYKITVIVVNPLGFNSRLLVRYAPF
jgi:hypothetical protein